MKKRLFFLHKMFPQFLHNYRVCIKFVNDQMNNICSKYFSSYLRQKQRNVVDIVSSCKLLILKVATVIPKSLVI